MDNSIIFILNNIIYGGVKMFNILVLFNFVMIGYIILNLHKNIRNLENQMYLLKNQIELCNDLYIVSALTNKFEIEEDDENDEEDF